MHPERKMVQQIIINRLLFIELSRIIRMKLISIHIGKALKTLLHHDAIRARKMLC
jgi:hypothetical protein